MTGKQLADYLLKMAPNEEVQIGTYISGGQNNPPYLQCRDVNGLIMHKGTHDENYKILIHDASPDQLNECIIHNPNRFKYLAYNNMIDMVLELEDPVKWVYDNYILPCDSMWIGRTRYVDKADEIWAAWEEIKKTDKWKQMYGNTDVI